MSGDAGDEKTVDIVFAATAAAEQSARRFALELLAESGGVRRSSRPFTVVGLPATVCNRGDVVGSFPAFVCKKGDELFFLRLWPASLVHFEMHPPFRACIFECLKSSSDLENFLLHMGKLHTKFRSPVCILRCLVRCSLRWNAFSHSLHLNGRLQLSVIATATRLSLIS